MARLSLITAAEAKGRSLSKSATGAAYHQQQYTVDKFPYFPHEDESLELFEVEFGPNAEIQPHAHSEDEIIYLLRGQIHLGSQTMQAGDALYIAKDTLYQFTVGSKGCSFLNFRATPNPAYYSKEQFLANRKAK